MFIYYINAFLSNRQFMLIMLSANSLVLCATFNMNYPWLRLCIHQFNNSAWTLFIHENILLNFINLITCSGEAIGCTIFNLGYAFWVSFYFFYQIYLYFFYLIYLYLTFQKLSPLCTKDQLKYYSP